MRAANSFSSISGGDVGDAGVSHADDALEQHVAPEEQEECVLILCACECVCVCVCECEVAVGPLERRLRGALRLDGGGVR